MDPQARRFIDMVSLAGPHDAAAVDIAARRSSFAKLMRFAKGPSEGVAVDGSEIVGRSGAIPVRTYTPARTARPAPGLLYLHGGGLVAGSIETHDPLCRTLAVESGCVILSVEYRLAPEFPFPAAIVDALAVARAVTRDPEAFGLRGDRIAIGGDSGGATLAAIVAQCLRRRNPFAAQVLLCPVLDCGPPSASRQMFARGFLIDAETMQADLRHYAPTRSLLDPRLSPLRAETLAGLPRTIIHTAGFDPLLDEGKAYAGRLEAAGVAVLYRCHDSLVHNYYGLTRIVTAAQEAVGRLAADIETVLA